MDAALPQSPAGPGGQKAAAPRPLQRAGKDRDSQAYLECVINKVQYSILFQILVHSWLLLLVLVRVLQVVEVVQRVLLLLLLPRVPGLPLLLKAARNVLPVV